MRRIYFFLPFGPSLLGLAAATVAWRCSKPYPQQPPSGAPSALGGTRESAVAAAAAPPNDGPPAAIGAAPANPATPSVEAQAADPSSDGALAATASEPEDPSSKEAPEAPASGTQPGQPSEPERAPLEGGGKDGVCTEKVQDRTAVGPLTDPIVLNNNMKLIPLPDAARLQAERRLQEAQQQKETLSSPKAKKSSGVFGFFRRPGGGKTHTRKRGY